MHKDIKAVVKGSMLVYRLHHSTHLGLPIHKDLNLYQPYRVFVVVVVFKGTAVICF